MPFGVEKLEWCGYPNVKKRFRFDRIPEYDRRTDRQIDRQTDRQTTCDGIVRAMHIASNDK